MKATVVPFLARQELESPKLFQKYAEFKEKTFCWTGIACEVFKGEDNLASPAVTVHCFIGIYTAQGLFDSVVEKVCDNPVVRNRLLKARCLV